jgi:hypothetical protein
MGFEPMNTGFADQRVSHFAIGALVHRAHYTSDRSDEIFASLLPVADAYFGCVVVRR